MENNHMNAVNYIIQAIKDGSNLPSEHYEYEIACIMVDYASQTAPKLVLPSVEEMRKYLNGYFGFGGDPSISDREYGFEHGYDYTIDEIKRLNGI